MTITFAINKQNVYSLNFLYLENSLSGTRYPKTNFFSGLFSHTYMTNFIYAERRNVVCV